LVECENKHRWIHLYTYSREKKV